MNMDRVLPNFVDIVKIDDVKGLVVSLALWLGVLSTGCVENPDLNRFYGVMSRMRFNPFMIIS